MSIHLRPIQGCLCEADLSEGPCKPCLDAARERADLAGDLWLWKLTATPGTLPREWVARAVPLMQALGMGWDELLATLDADADCILDAGGGMRHAC